MVISNNPKSTMYRNLYENTGPGDWAYSHAIQKTPDIEYYNKLF